MSATEAPFVWDFQLDRKAIQETATGDVIVSGYASTWDEDRADEAFEPGAFSRGLRRFLTTNPQVLWAHNYEVPLGVVEDARIDQKGLFVRCRLDAAEPGTVAADVIRRVLRGSLKAFSVGGIWKRRMTPQGMRIHEADVMEVSIASVPVNAAALITSVARKSFENEHDHTLELIEMKSKLADLRAALSGKPEPEARATMLYAHNDPEGDARRAQAWERQRSYEAQRQAQLVDGPRAEADTFEGTVASFFGYEVERKLPDNVRGEQTFELSGDQVAGLFGAVEARDPRDLPGRSAFDTFGAPSAAQKVAGMIDKLKVLEGSK